jgi:hypothetical protein
MEIGLGALIRFANASERARPRIAQRIAEESQNEYSPATDYWRPVRQAIARDRRTSRDGAELRRVALAAPPIRRPNFESISERWSDMTSRWAMAHHAPAKSKFVELDGVRVRLSPLFVEQWDDGHGERAHVWFNKEELKPATVEAVRRVLSLAHNDDVAIPVFIDMRRGFVTASADGSPAADGELDDLARQFRRFTES